MRHLISFAEFVNRVQGERVESETLNFREGKVLVTMVSGRVFEIGTILNLTKEGAVTAYLPDVSENS